MTGLVLDAHFRWKVCLPVELFTQLFNQCSSGK